MQVKATFIIKEKGKYRILYELFDGKYFILTSYDSGEPCVEEISQKEAIKLINEQF